MSTGTDDLEHGAAVRRPPIPPELSRWLIWNVGLLVAFIGLGIIVPSPLPMVILAGVAAVVWVHRGWTLASNRNRLAERWAAWGQSRSLFIGAGSSSVPVNRLVGFGLLAGGLFLAYATWWLAVPFWRSYG